MSDDKNKNMSTKVSRVGVPKYCLSVRFLHWLFAALFVCSLLSGLVMTEINNVNRLSYVMPKYHYLSGVLLLFLTCVRVAIRVVGSRPSYADDIAQLEIVVAKCVQWMMLIAGLLLMLTGYVLATADGNPALLPWGAWLPQILPDDLLSLELGLFLHKTALIIFCGCLLLHLVGFIKHQISDRSFYKRIL